MYTHQSPYLYSHQSPPLSRTHTPHYTPPQTGLQYMYVRNKICYFDFFQDYHNITPRRFYLPPLHQHAWPSTPAIPRQVSTHKTFTTRKGALLLYAEDLALTTCEAEPVQKTTKSLEAEDTSLFNNFGDLRSAILSYGAKVSNDCVLVRGLNKREPLRQMPSKFDESRQISGDKM